MQTITQQHAPLRARQVRLRQAALFLVVLLLGAACEPAAAPTLIPTATPSITVTPPPSLTPSLTPTLTPTATFTPSDTPTPTLTPTPTETPTPLPSPTPQIAFAGDNWELVDVVPPLGGRLTESWVAFANSNDRDNVGNPLTPGPETNVQMLYLLNPRTSQRVEVFSIPASTEGQVFWTQAGDRVAFFNDEPGQRGLYVLDLSIGLVSRVLRTESLTQRGFFSPPQWSPNGAQIALAAATGYGDLDVFLMNADGTALRPIIDHPAYDFWPVWSPDGRYIAFVSDRDTCPNWRDGSDCAAASPNGPRGGQLHLLTVATGEVRRLSEVIITEPPSWINNRLIGFAVGDLAGGDTFRHLWQADIVTQTTSAITLPEGSDAQYYLTENWSPDGTRVAFQRAGQTTALALMSQAGQLLASNTEYNFARYAFRATWSPNGTRLAFGGHNGQCPYGLVVMSADFTSVISSANPPPTACDPVFSPDGQWIAYAGINPQIDGRLDLYVANANGYSTLNHTASLRGQVRVLGWVGGGGS